MMTLNMNDDTQRCEADATCTRPQERLRGDLLVCVEHSKTMTNVVGDEVRCSCGYYRPIGVGCGEPCL